MKTIKLNIIADLELSIDAYNLMNNLIFDECNYSDIPKDYDSKSKYYSELEDFGLIKIDRNDLDSYVHLTKFGKLFKIKYMHYVKY